MELFVSLVMVGCIVTNGGHDGRVNVREEELHPRRYASDEFLAHP